MKRSRPSDRCRSRMKVRCRALSRPNSKANVRCFIAHDLQQNVEGLLLTRSICLLDKYFRQPIFGSLRPSSSVSSSAAHRLIYFDTLSRVHLTMPRRSDHLQKPPTTYLLDPTFVQENLNYREMVALSGLFRRWALYDPDVTPIRSTEYST